MAAQWSRWGVRHCLRPLVDPGQGLTMIKVVQSMLWFIIANRKLSLQPMVQRCYIRLFILKICMNHINQSNFIRAKFTRRTRNWRATRIQLGRKRSQRSCIFDWKRTSQDGPTGDERGNRRESPVGYRWWKRKSMRITRGLPTMVWFTKFWSTSSTHYRGGGGGNVFFENR